MRRRLKIDRSTNEMYIVVHSQVLLGRSIPIEAWKFGDATALDIWDSSNKRISINIIPFRWLY